MLPHHVVTVTWYCVPQKGKEGPKPFFSTLAAVDLAALYTGPATYLIW